MTFDHAIENEIEGEGGLNQEEVAGDKYHSFSVKSING